MAIIDQISDMLNRIRNASIVRHDTVEIPSSKMKLSIVKIFKDEGFINDYEVIKAKPEKLIKVVLKYGENNQPIISGLERVSKPGLRIYVHRDEIPRVYGGLGVAIMSTPKGVVTGQQAWRQGLGGEVLCFIW
jgi:small subunit ribosomal protein S8